MKKLQLRNKKYKMSMKTKQACVLRNNWFHYMCMEHFDGNVQDLEDYLYNRTTAAKSIREDEEVIYF